MAQHRNLTSDDCHEPKNISTARTTDAGKVLTPSDTVRGQSVLRRLTIADVDGLESASPAFVVLNADGIASRTLPALAGPDEEQESVEINSLFTAESVDISPTTSSIVFNRAGRYLVRLNIETSSDTDALYTLEYVPDSQATPRVIATDVPSNGIFSMELLVREEQGSVSQFTAYSSSNTSLQVSIKRSISIFRVA